MTAVGTRHAVLNDTELSQVDALWRAANYLAAGQIYLMDNPLLRIPLLPEHIKPRLLGHWGTSPGLNFVYAHLNRAILTHDLNVMLVTGPGHGGPALLANTWLEGSYSEAWPEVTRDGEGMDELFRQFSFPGGVPSHVGSAGARLDPRGRRAGLLARPRVRRRVRQPGTARRVCGRRRRGGDRSACRQLAREQVPRSASATVRCCRSCTSTATRSPTPRCSPGSHRAELDSLLRGYGYAPIYVEGDDPDTMHQAMAAALDSVASPSWP